MGCAGSGDDPTEDGSLIFVVAKVSGAGRSNHVDSTTIQSRLVSSCREEVTRVLLISG